MPNVSINKSYYSNYDMLLESKEDQMQKHTSEKIPQKFVVV